MRYAALALLSVATTIVLLVPAVTGRDDFPVSTHPMYATARPATASFVTARGMTATSQPIELTMAVIAGTDDPLVAETRMRRAVRRDGAGALCAAVALRVGEERTADVDSIEVIRIEANVTDFVRQGLDGSAAEVLATCPAP